LPGLGIGFLAGIGLAGFFIFASLNKKAPTCGANSRSERGILLDVKILKIDE